MNAQLEFAGSFLLAANIMGGTENFDAEDDTFKEAGAVGVWTKADSVTLFDDFTFGNE